MQEISVGNHNFGLFGQNASGGGRLTNFRAKKWLPDWIYTMSDDMANQRGIFQDKKNGSLTWIRTKTK